MTEKKEPIKDSSFIHIAPGAKVDKLTARNNKIRGVNHFINNQGDLTNSELKGNEHHKPSTSSSSIPHWYTNPFIIAGLSLAVLLIVAWATNFFGWSK